MQQVSFNPKVLNFLINLPFIALSYYRIGREATRSIGDDEDLDTDRILTETANLSVHFARACGYYSGHMTTSSSLSHQVRRKPEILCENISGLLGPSPRIVLPEETGLRGKYILTFLLSPAMVVIDTVRKVGRVATLAVGLDKRRPALSRRCYEISREVLQIILQPLRTVALVGAITIGVIHPRTGQKTLQVVARVFGNSTFLILRKLASSGSLSRPSIAPINQAAELVQKNPFIKEPLPGDVLQLIFSFVSHVDRARVASTCQYFASICRPITVQKAQEFFEEVMHSKRLFTFLLRSGIDMSVDMPETYAEAVTFFTNLSLLVKAVKEKYPISGTFSGNPLSSAGALDMFLDSRIPLYGHGNIDVDLSKIINRSTLQKNEHKFYRFSTKTLSHVLVAAAKKNVSLQDIFSGRSKNFFFAFPDDGPFLQKEWRLLLSLIRNPDLELEAEIRKRVDPMVLFLIKVHQDFGTLTYNHPRIAERASGFQPDFLCPLSLRPIEHAVHHTKNRGIVADQKAVQDFMQRGIKRVEILGYDLALSEFESEENRETQEVITRTIALYGKVINVLHVWADILSHARDLPVFPSCVPHDPDFPRCSITRKTIRYVACPQGHPNIFYERSAIANWLGTHTQEIPPAWPFGLPFSGDTICWKNPEQQRTIDEFLRGLEGATFTRQLIEWAKTLSGFSANTVAFAKPKENVFLSDV